MATILEIIASPRGEKSASLEVMRAFCHEYRETHSDTTIETLNLFDEALPAFDGQAVWGKYAILYGKPAGPETKAAFAKVEAVIERFKAADVYAFAVPMWNFGIPYVLKHLIDLVVQPTYTFRVDDEGYHGLLGDKTAVLCYARGGQYKDGGPMDFQRQYMETVLGFMGITHVHGIVTQGLLAGSPEQTEAKVEAAKVEARALARNLRLAAELQN